MLNKLISNVVPMFPKPFIWQFSKKYVAGETIGDAMRISSKLNDSGMEVTIDQLGEFVVNFKQVEINRKSYIDLIKSLKINKIRGTVSLKPTSFGLLLDEDRCYENVRSVVLMAKKENSFVRIDMEDSPCTSKEIALFKRLHREFAGHVGLVIQAYMRRSLDDLRGLAAMHTAEFPINIRLCKGIYLESVQVAYQGAQEVRDNYITLLKYLLKEGIYVGIATHDRGLVERSCEILDDLEISKGDYEFQMLYGVLPNLRDEIVSRGHRMRIYVPYGMDWFGYCTRRLKENPKMATDIIKAMFIKG